MTKLFAAIDIGSNYIRMSISEFNSNNEPTILENVIKPTSIGTDTFSTGRISISTINELCRDLKNFSLLMQQYNITNYLAVATSGMREAENNQYAINQLFLKTGIEIKIINSSEERYFMLRALKNNYCKNLIFNDDATLIINITSSYVELYIYNNGILKYVHNFMLGSLRVSESLNELQEKTSDFFYLLEEFLYSKLYFIKNIISKYNIKHFIGLGGELKLIKQFKNNMFTFKDEEFYISSKNFNKFFNELKTLSIEDAQFKYNLSKKSLDLVTISMLTFNWFFKETDAIKLVTPDVSLRQGILYFLNDTLNKKGDTTYTTDDIINLCFSLCEKYNLDIAHAKHVQNLSLALFDATKKIHRLTISDRLFLQVAAILHDIGTFVSTDEHHIHSALIIKNESILGFSDSKLNIIANIAKYHANAIPLNSDIDYSVLSDTDKMKVSILSSILKLAENLDMSHNYKIKNINASISKGFLLINLNTSENTDVSLEKWAFEKNSIFFEEVLGVKPVIL